MIGVVGGGRNVNGARARGGRWGRTSSNRRDFNHRNNSERGGSLPVRVRMHSNEPGGDSLVLEETVNYPHWIM